MIRRRSFSAGLLAASALPLPALAQGKKGGDVIDFVMAMEGLPRNGGALTAAKKLLEWFPQNDTSSKSLTHETKTNETAAKTECNSSSKSLTMPVPEENKTGAQLGRVLFLRQIRLEENE